MEQFVLVRASLYNKSVTRQSVTKQELPKCEAEQPPTYQINSLKRDFNQKLFSKANTLIDKILPLSRINFSNSQTMTWDSVDTGVLISDFTQHLRWKNADLPDNYFTLFDAAAISSSQPESQSWRERKLGPFERMEVRSCKDCIRKVLLLTVLYATWQNVADYQYQRWNKFYVQRLLIQNLLWQHDNSREWELLLNSKTKLGVKILLTLTNWRKRVTV